MRLKRSRFSSARQSRGPRWTQSMTCLPCNACISTRGHGPHEVFKLIAPREPGVHVLCVADYVPDVVGLDLDGVAAVAVAEGIVQEPSVVKQVRV